MTHAQQTVTVQRPISDVFAYLADGTNNKRWRPGVLEIERTAGDGGVGTTYRQIMKGPGGTHIPGDYRVTGYDAPNLLTFDVTAGPVRPHGRFELASASADSTTLTFTLDAEPSGLMKLMSGMVGRQMQTEVGHLADLKQDLET